MEQNKKAGANSPGYRDRKMGNIGTASESNPVTTHGIFNTIIYINTFEEDKVDSLIPEISSGKEVYEWNETNGYIDFETKTPLQEDCSLERMLDQLKTPDLLDRKILIFKDITSYLDDPRIVSKVKGLARMINQGVDATCCGQAFL